MNMRKPQQRKKNAKNAQEKKPKALQKSGKSFKRNCSANENTKTRREIELQMKKNKKNATEATMRPPGAWLFVRGKIFQKQFNANSKANQRQKTCRQAEEQVRTTAKNVKSNCRANEKNNEKKRRANENHQKQKKRHGSQNEATRKSSFLLNA